MDKLSKFAEENGLPEPLIEEDGAPEPQWSPDPQWEAAIRGDCEALHNEISFYTCRLDRISHDLKSLAKGLKENVSTKYTDAEGTEWVRSGSLRVPASTRSKCDNPPTKIE